MTFISLINENNELIQCDTCCEIGVFDTYEYDGDNEKVYCSTNCLVHSFEFNMIPTYSY
jgi:hypothetical protein